MGSEMDIEKLEGVVDRIILAHDELLLEKDRLIQQLNTKDTEIDELKLIIDNLTAGKDEIRSRVNGILAKLSNWEESADNERVASPSEQEIDKPAQLFTMEN